MKWLMDISNHMNKISCEQCSFSSLLIDIGFERSFGLINYNNRRHSRLCVVDGWDEGVGDKWTKFYLFNELRVDKMPFVPNTHVVFGGFEVVWPDCRLDEGSCAVVTETIDGEGELFELDAGSGIELVESDFSNGSGEHVSDVPPGEDHGR